MKNRIDFSYPLYQNSLVSGELVPPSAFKPFIPVNPVRYSEIENQHSEKDGYRYAFGKLRQRVSEDYYWKVYPAQSRTLDYAHMAFPAYKFHLPQMLADDWLAVVGWHKEFSRDHALHQPMTAYIVMQLLGGGTPDNSLAIDGISLLDRCVDQVLAKTGTLYLWRYLNDSRLRHTPDVDLWLGSKPHRGLWTALFVEAAYLAAVFHDMGYPWQYVHSLAGKLRHADHTHAAMPIESPSEIIRLFGQRLFFCALTGYRVPERGVPCTWSKELEEIIHHGLTKTHGVPGALGFLYLNDILRDFPNSEHHPIREFCVDWAAMAIMMHDMSRIYWGKNTRPQYPHLRLRFNVDPLSCLLTLADQLQDFERPAVQFSQNRGRCCVEYPSPSPCQSTHIASTGSTLNIEYRMSSDAERVRKAGHLQKEHRELFHATDGYIDLSACGVKNVAVEATHIRED